MKPKKLNLREIHSLYRLLEHSLPREEENYLIDEIDEMLSRIESSALMDSFDILYKGNWRKKNDIELLILFIRGLRENDFFNYVTFIQGFKKKVNG